jgi:hypothetical protein
MGRGLHFLTVFAGAATLAAGTLHAQEAAAPPEPIHPQAHVAGWPDALQWNPMQGPEMQRGRSARAMLEERRRLDAALAGLQPQRAGTVDAYVVAIALDSDPVFAREAREAGNVLSRRYDAVGRTLVLAGPDGRSGGLPRGSISTLAVALAHIAEIIDPAEDVLVLYSTSHGIPQGLAYHDGDSGYGVLSPAYLGTMLGELGFERRMLLLSACYSGVFVPYLATHDTAIATASAADRTSFGCRADNDWTYFGDALVNNALRKPQGLAMAAEEARTSISEWEARAGLMPSLPQVQIGEGARLWLRYLESRMPATASEPVGRPAAGG